STKSSIADDVSRSFRRSECPNPGRSIATRCACSASRDHICSNVKRLSGHGLRRIADTSRASLSAYRIDKPSIFRTCVFMSEWVEMVIMGSLTRDRCFDLRLECGCVSPTFPTFVFVTIRFFFVLPVFEFLLIGTAYLSAILSGLP